MTSQTKATVSRETTSLLGIPPVDGLSSCHNPIIVFPALMSALSLLSSPLSVCHSTMAAYLWLVLAIVSDVAESLLHPSRQLSHCQVVSDPELSCRSSRLFECFHSCQPQISMSAETT
jgi:hypothetical protein